MLPHRALPRVQDGFVGVIQTKCQPSVVCQHAIEDAQRMSAPLPPSPPVLSLLVSAAHRPGALAYMRGLSIASLDTLSAVQAGMCCAMIVVST